MWFNSLFKLKNCGFKFYHASLKKGVFGSKIRCITNENGDKLNPEHFYIRPDGAIFSNDDKVFCGFAR